MNTKQIIVMRKFKSLRTGKYIAQACHASMAFLTRQGGMIHNEEFGEYGSQFTTYLFENCGKHMKQNFDEIDHWLKNSFKKVVVYVDNEEELVAIHEKALAAGLISHLVEDNGATEFNGVKTKTAVAIGPHSDDKFEGITDHLKLL
jgi:PTH2 family peptidyl-tRNA hydrolase